MDSVLTHWKANDTAFENVTMIFLKSIFHENEYPDDSKQDIAKSLLQEANSHMVPAHKSSSLTMVWQDSVRFAAGQQAWAGIQRYVNRMQKGSCILLKLQKKRCNQITDRFSKMGIISRITIWKYILTAVPPDAATIAPSNFATFCLFFGSIAETCITYGRNTLLGIGKWSMGFGLRAVDLETIAADSIFREYFECSLATTQQMKNQKDFLYGSKFSKKDKKASPVPLRFFCIQTECL